jgi:hypothetical protein
MRRDLVRERDFAEGEDFVAERAFCGVDPATVVGDSVTYRAGSRAE